MLRENGGEITISIFGKVTFVGDDDIFYDDADAFLDCIREELPYRDTTGFRYEVLTDDPAIRKAADDILCGSSTLWVHASGWTPCRIRMHRWRLVRRGNWTISTTPGSFI